MMKIWTIVAIAGLLAAFGLMAQRVKILTLERDQANDARVIAEDTLKRIRRESILMTEALEGVRKAEHDRYEFITENTVAIEQGRQEGDGPLAPVLRDALERVRRRYAGRLDQNGNPR